MKTEKLCFKKYLKCIDDKFLSKTRKRVNNSNHKKRMYGNSNFENDAGGSNTEVSESLIVELMSGNTQSLSANSIVASQFTSNSEENEERKINKIDIARTLFQSLIRRSNLSRKDIIEELMNKVGITHSTATSYYERLAKEAGLTNADKEDIGVNDTQQSKSSRVVKNTDPVNELPANTSIELDDEIEDTFNQQSDEQGIIRTVKNAHLIYKKQMGDGSYEELWIYNIKKGTRDELDIRKDIIAGTDIPEKSTKSPDGKQQYTLTTLGNAQYLHITGLPN